MTKDIELMAKSILIYLFSDKYKNLELCESPDLQSHNPSVGVEVTSILKQDIHKDLNVKCRAGFVGTNNSFKKMYNQKIKKFDQYKKFQENNLYCETIEISKEDLVEIIQIIDEDKIKAFDKIYLYYNLNLVEVDSESLEVKKYKIPLSDWEYMRSKISDSCRKI